MPASNAYYKCSCQNCGGHIEFPARAAGTTVACPHCNWQTLLQPPPAPPGSAPHPRRKWAPFSIAAVILLAAAAGWAYRHFNPPVRLPDQPRPLPEKTVAAPPKTNAPDLPPPRPDPWHGLMASSVTLEKAEEGGLIYAIGTLKNESDHQRFGVKVQLDFFDDQGKNVGSSTDYTASIVPGKEWKFKVLVFEHQTVRAELAKVTEQE